MRPNQRATRENAGKASLDADGNLVGYVSGYPFPPEGIDVDDPSGPASRWRGTSTGTPAASGWSSTPIDWRIIKRGTMVRRLYSYYWRLYFCNKPEYAEMPDGCLTSDTNIEWKEFNHFTEPFDVKDTMLILHRYLDATKDDALDLPARFAPAWRRFGATQKSELPARYGGRARRLLGLHQQGAGAQLALPGQDQGPGRNERGPGRVRFRRSRRAGIRCTSTTRSATPTCWKPVPLGGDTPVQPIGALPRHPAAEQPVHAAPTTATGSCGRAGRFSGSGARTAPSRRITVSTSPCGWGRT